jgi:hypothetical protein
VKIKPNTNNPKFPIIIEIIEGISPKNMAGAMAPLIY